MGFSIQFYVFGFSRSNRQIICIISKSMNQILNAVRSQNQLLEDYVEKKLHDHFPYFPLGPYLKTDKAVSKKEGPKNLRYPTKKQPFIQKRLLFCRVSQIFLALLILKQLQLAIYAMSFYISKIILERPNCFGQVQIVLDRYKLFWSCFCWVQIFLVRFILEFSGLIFMVWTCPK